MQRQLVITIGRTFGSKGREIGEKLAQDLNISFYDKNIITLAAEQDGLDKDLASIADEKIIYKFIDSYNSPGEGKTTFNEKLYRAQSDIIKKIAESESCVIVGRMADYILREFPNCLKVFIYAPMNSRVNTIKGKYNLSTSQATRLIKKMDKIRRNHYSYFSNEIWDKKEGKDIFINSALFGVDGSLKIIKHIVELGLLQ